MYGTLLSESDRRSYIVVGVITTCYHHLALCVRVFRLMEAAGKWVLGGNKRGQMYFVFCRLDPSSPQPSLSSLYS
jgi:hypothetical protein